MSRFRLVVGSASHVGRVREHQEDAHLEMPEVHLAMVADGMGGHQAGDVASALAVAAVGEHFGTTSHKPGHGGLGAFLRRLGSGSLDPAGRLSDAVHRANRRILDTAKGRPEYKGMGTTVVLLWLVGDRLWHAHVGDSRLYLWREGVLEQVTVDHSLLNEYLRLGVLSPEQAPRFPYKNVIVRAVGLSPGLEVDVGSREARIGDRLLLCSDGLTDLVEDDRIRSELADGEDPRGAADRLVALALAAGGIDNVTAVVAHVRGEDEGP